MAKCLASRALAIVLVASLQGCDADLSGVQLSGTWGGPHVVLTVLEGRAVLDYDCAHGTLDEPLRLDAGGRFQANGVHVREHGGPIREGEVPDAHPALYTGRSDGREMTLTVTLTDSGERLGTFSLVRGQAGFLTKCL